MLFCFPNFLFFLVVKLLSAKIVMWAKSVEFTGNNYGVLGMHKRSYLVKLLALTGIGLTLRRAAKP